MRIGKFYIKNFKAIAPLETVFDLSQNILIAIGENNAGKSSILQALDFFFSGIKTIPREQFCNCLNDPTNAISIKVEFIDLSARDKAHPAIAPYITTDGKIDKWILQKKYYYAEDKGKCDYIAIVNGEEKKNPGGLTQNCDDLFTNEKMQKIFLPAVQNISEIVDGKKKSAFSQIFQLLLSEELKETEEYVNLMDALKKYAEIFEAGNKNAKVSEIEGLISDKIKRIINADGLIDVQLPQEEKLLPAPTLTIDDGREIPVSPIYQGHGLQRSLIFALLELYAESVSAPGKDLGVNNLLLIEEPEIYMHPQMERKVSDVLYNLASSGSVQIVCTTHSPIFIKAIDNERTLARIIRRPDNSFKVVQKKEHIFNSGTEKDEKDKIKMISTFDPTVNELFFAKRVVLLEGDTEYIILPMVAQMINAFCDGKNRYKEREVTLINCRSRDYIPAFQKVLNYYEIPYVVVHDTEGEEKDKGVNAKILRLLDGDESLRKLFDPKIEDYLGASDGGTKWYNVLKKVRELDNSGDLNARLGSYIKFIYNLT